MQVIKAEYIWIDGTKPDPLLRSKTKLIYSEDKQFGLPVWGFDGSSTNQAPGNASDCVLNPVFVCSDPLRSEGDLLVMCEVRNVDGTAHVGNTRYDCARVEQQFAEHEMIFGLEQEYTLFKEGRPLGFPEDGLPAPQGQYYCGVGSENAFGREIVEEHLAACLGAGLLLAGINAEVMPGQWEFQIGPLPPTAVSDQLWIARYLLQRVSERHGVSVSYDPKPMSGDWNGAGCHTNFSTRKIRERRKAYEGAITALETNAMTHMESYGPGVERRLTGLHETCAHTEFRCGVSDRGASVRIPWQVALDERGYLEDRRPNANCDPYTVTRLITQTVREKEDLDVND